MPLYTFKNPKREVALPWKKDFSELIESCWSTEFIMIYFNTYTPDMPAEDHEKFYTTLLSEIPKHLNTHCYYNLLVKDTLIDYVIGISHEIPENEIGYLIKNLIKTGCVVSPTASYWSKTYGF